MSVRFDAAGDEANRTANVPPNASFTYMLWSVIDNDRGSANYQPLLFVLDAGSASGYSLGLISNVLDVEVHTSGGTTSSFMASRPAAGTPACFFLRSAGTGTNLLTGGYRTAGQNSFVTSQNTLGGISAGATLYLGGVFSTYWTDGRKWNLKVWDRALSDAEILIESYHREVKFPTSLNLWLPWDNSADVNDKSGNARNPTVVGTLTTGVTPAGLWTPSRRIFLPPTVVNGTASGFLLTATTSLIPGAASAGLNGTATGQTLTANASLIAGAASAVRSPTTTGQTLAVTASLIPGKATNGLVKFVGPVVAGGTDFETPGVTIAASTTIDGDLDVVVVGAGSIAVSPGEAPTIDTPLTGDWEVQKLSGNFFLAGALRTRLYVFSRWATGPSSSQAFTSSEDAMWGYTRQSYRDVHRTTPFGQIEFDYKASGTSMTLIDLVSTLTDSMRVDWLSLGAAQPATIPAGQTERYNDDIGVDGLVVTDEQVPNVGATGVRIFGTTPATDAVTASFLLYGLGSVSGATNGTANGATLTTTTSLVPGSASGVRSPTQAGFTLTAVASLLAGTATGQTNMTAAGGLMTATASLVPGAAAGQSNATAGGQTVTAAASILAGTASADRNPTATGQVLVVTTSLIPGGASSGVSPTAPGQTLAVTSSLVAGAASATRSATASGQVLGVVSSLLAGTATGQRQPTASGTVLSAVASLVNGSAAGQRNSTAAGMALTAVASLLAGTASADNGAVAFGALFGLTSGFIRGLAFADGADPVDFESETARYRRIAQAVERGAVFGGSSNAYLKIGKRSKYRSM